MILVTISAPVPAPVITSSTACISLGTRNTVSWNPAATAPWLGEGEGVEEEEEEEEEKGDRVTVRWREEVVRRRGEGREWQE